MVCRLDQSWVDCPLLIIMPLPMQVLGGLADGALLLLRLCCLTMLVPYKAQLVMGGTPAEPPKDDQTKRHPVRIASLAYLNTCCTFIYGLLWKRLFFLILGLPLSGGRDFLTSLSPLPLSSCPDSKFSEATDHVSSPWKENVWKYRSLFENRFPC